MTQRGVPKCKCGKVVTGYRHLERDGLCVNCLIDAYVELMGQAQAANPETPLFDSPKVSPPPSR